MKVIGKSKKGFIVDVSDEEIVLMLGYNSRFDDGYKNLKIDEGFESDITAFKTVLNSLKRLDEEKLKHAGKELASLQNHFDALEKTIKEIRLFDILKGE